MNVAGYAGSSDRYTFFVVVALVSDVWLGVGAWETWCTTEMSLGFSVLGSSKEECVGTYYNILIRIGEELEDIRPVKPINQSLTYR